MLYVMPCIALLPPRVMKLLHAPVQQVVNALPAYVSLFPICLHPIILLWWCSPVFA